MKHEKLIYFIAHNEKILAENTIRLFATFISLSKGYINLISSTTFHCFLEFVYVHWIPGTR